MDVSNPRNRIGGSRAAQLLSSRQGALIVAVVAALLAGGLFYLFAQNYKTNTTPTVPPQYVLVATKDIPVGAAGQVIAQEGLFKSVLLPGKQVVAGAITNKALILSAVTAVPIPANTQLTAAEFSRANLSITSYLSGDQRAISIPFDPSHGSTANLAQGDTVDVMMTAGGKTTLIAQNVTVLSNVAGIVVVRVSDKQALLFANSSDNAKLWLSLRPPAGAQQSISLGASAGPA